MMTMSTLRKEAIPMVLQDALPLKQSVWHVTRRFEGEKSPEDLLRALIQAHKP